MLPKIISISRSKSTQIGGIPYYIRTLQEFFEGNEKFEFFSNDCEYEIFKERTDVNYIKLDRWNLGKKNNTIFSAINLILECIFPHTLKRFNEVVNPKDVIIVNDFIDLLTIRKKFFKIAKVILVQHTRPDVFFKPHKRILIRALVKKKLSLLSCIVCFTKYDKVEIDNILSVENIKYTPIPLSTHINKKQNNRKGTTFIFIGRLDDKTKNLQGLIKICDMVDYEIEIYGDGPDKKMILEAADKKKNILYKGTTIDVTLALEGKTALLITSFSEGYAAVVAEAICSSVPVIAFDTYPALEFLLGDNERGYKVPFGEYNKFVDCMEKLAENDVDFYEKSTNCYEFSDELNMEVMKRNWKGLIENFNE